MASDVVICQPLCFLVKKYGSMPVVTLKSIVTDFYEQELIGKAKIQLHEDILKLDIADKLPHIPVRRSTTDRLAKEVDDIFAMLSFIDENKRFDSLPNYAIINPDYLPPLKLFDGDVKFLMSKVDGLADMVGKVISSMGAMSNSVQSISQAVQQVVEQTVHKVLQSYADKEEEHRSTTTTRQSKPVAGPSQIEICTLEQSINTVNTAGYNDTGPRQERRSWAAQSVRPVSLASATDDDGEFIMVESRRRRRQKRTRDSPVPADDNNQSYAGKVRRNNNKPLVIGKSASNSDGADSRNTNSAIRAAKPIIQRSFF